MHGKSNGAPRPDTGDEAMIVTIDGPAGAGKSTVARLVAAKLGYAYFDTGALYRAVAWKALATETDPTSPVAMAKLCQQTRLVPSVLQSGHAAVEIDGRLLGEELRTPEVSRAATQIAAIPEVRAWLLSIQRAVAQRPDIRGIVAEGRDTGTCVFPEAPAKFFLEADAAERARRRHTQLVAAGNAEGLADTRRDLDARDSRDRTRESAPLVPAKDAMVIDTTGLSVEQVVARMLEAITEKPGR